ncbi:MAG: protein Asterix [Sulfurovum sp.]|nr:protein Asterix [Sulfurovum sp.]
MGLGYLRRDLDIVPATVVPVQPTASPPLDVWKVLKGVGGVLSMLALLVSLVWWAATSLNSKAPSKDVKELDKRVQLVEKNDVAQTVLLEGIKETLDKVEVKLDKALTKSLPN